jgi:hypothetical protein
LEVSERKSCRRRRKAGGACGASANKPLGSSDLYQKDTDQEKPGKKETRVGRKQSKGGNAHLHHPRRLQIPRSRAGSCFVLPCRTSYPPRWPCRLSSVELLVSCSVRSLRTPPGTRRRRFRSRDASGDRTSRQCVWRSARCSFLDVSKSFGRIDERAAGRVVEGSACYGPAVGLWPGDSIRASSRFAALRSSILRTPPRALATPPRRVLLLAFRVPRTASRALEAVPGR